MDEAGRDWRCAGRGGQHLGPKRVASSGEQQMVERSIVNRVFTIDRQSGAMVHGRVGEGGGLDFAAVDFERTRKVRAILAVAASGNQSAYSRFASDGAGQVEDLPDGVPGQYALSQWAAQGALKWGGVSAQQEFHWKHVVDRVTGGSQRLTGFYVQGGFFAHEFWPSMPRPLELTSRYATVDPDLDDFEAQRGEVAVGTAESSTRVRLPWDVSF